MKRIWLWIISRLFPGTIEEYHAGREIHRREEKIYRRQPQYIIGAVLFAGPLFFLLLSDVLHWPWKLLIFPMTFGLVCIRDTVAEHYVLLLLRRERELATPKA